MTPIDPIQLELARARQAAERGDLPTAITRQADAVAQARLALGTSPAPEALSEFGVMLYNLAGYHLNAEHFAEAIPFLEEVVAIDRQLAQPDLETDEQALAVARHLASLSPEQLAEFRAHREANAAEDDDLDPATEALAAALEARIAAEWGTLTDEERAQMNTMVPPTEIDPQMQISTLAVQAAHAVRMVKDGQADAAHLLAQLDDLAGQIETNNTEGHAGWADLALFLRGLDAHLRGDPALPVPAAFAEHWAMVQ